MQKRFSWLPVFIRNCNPADELCDWNTGYGTLYCGSGTGSCPGSCENGCYAHHVWSSNRVGDSNAWSPELWDGRFFGYHGDAGHDIYYAFGVRCVLDAEYF